MVLVRYALGSTLGTGNFSAVTLALKRETGEKLAVKVVEKKKLGAPPQRVDCWQKGRWVKMCI